jgi:putative SOS response-associated peptidase YedK
MPAILPPEHFGAWLECRGVAATEAAKLLAPAADDVLEVIEVSAKLNNPRNEGPELQEPVSRALL